MATPVIVGTRVEDIELLDLFPPDEGSIDQYYGRIGNGKTYAGTADILADLAMGRVVYANWMINFEGFDERESFGTVLVNLLFFRKRFYKFSKENFHYIEIDDDFIDKLIALTDCKVYLDEGHVIFDSYQQAKMSMKKRTAVLHTRHFNRSIAILSQRPTAVHVSARANVNRFFKCEKLIDWPFKLFRKSEYQDLLDESVNDQDDPVSTELYIGKSRIFNAYNSKYLRGGIPKSQEVHFEAYDLSTLQKLMLLTSFMRFPALAGSANFFTVDNLFDMFPTFGKLFVGSLRDNVELRPDKEEEAVPIVPPADSIR